MIDQLERGRDGVFALFVLSLAVRVATSAQTVVSRTWWCEVSASVHQCSQPAIQRSPSAAAAVAAGGPCLNNKRQASSVQQVKVKRQAASWIVTINKIVVRHAWTAHSLTLAERCFAR